MKRLLVSISCVFISLSVYASDGAKLRIHISGAGSSNEYFLCVGHSGCLSIKAGNHGQTYPISEGNIDRVYASSLKTMRLYTQPLPSSCNVEVHENETVTISGKITKASNDKIYISNLRCAVS